VLAEELRIYEAHLLEKQQRLLHQFEATAKESRDGVVEEELASMRRDQPSATGEQLAESMRGFEANLDREIDVQRSQLMTTLSSNRAAKLHTYRRELALKMESFMQQQHQQQAESSASPTSLHEQTTVDASPAHSIHSQEQQRQLEAQAEANASIAAVAAEQVRRDGLEQQRLAAHMAETERLEKVAHEARLRQAEQERKARLETMPTPVHRYEFQLSKPTVTRVHDTPSASPVASPLPSFTAAAPSSSPVPLHIPAASPPAKSSLPMPTYTPSLEAAQVMAPMRDPEAELRRKWQMLQQELHGKAESSTSQAWQPRVSPAASPAPAVPAVSHLQAVDASPVRAGRGPEENTQHTLNKLEAALEMDWGAAWEELSTQPQQQQRALPQSTPAHQYRPPASTPMTEKMSKAVVVSRHPNASPSRSLSHAHHQPAALLQQASGLFKTTLHELEEKADYLNQLISAFREAEREMESKVQQQRQQQESEQTMYEYGGGEVDQEAYEEDPRVLQRDANDSAAARCRQSAPGPRAASATRPRASSLGPNSSAVHPKVACAQARTSAAQHPPAQRPRSAVNVQRTGSLPRPSSVRKPIAAGAASQRKPIPSSIQRSASSSSIPRATSSYNRPSLSAAPAALSYPRPRTASARAALRPSTAGATASKSKAAQGVRQARLRIKAIVDKTRVKPVGISVLQHPKPTQAFTKDAFAKGGMRQATVQEVLVGANEIEERKDMTPAERRAAEQARLQHLKRDRHPAGGDEYDFVESSPERPHRPLSMVQVARDQRQASERLTHHLSGQVAPSPNASYSAADESRGSVDLNTTEGLIKQHEALEQRHDGHLEQYLKAVQFGTQEERHEALARLAAKAAQQQPPSRIYASPLRTHPSHRYPSQSPQQQETFSRRSDAIIRGSHANAAQPTPIVRGPSAMQALQGIIQQHPGPQR
jgi:hypothetical protein